MQLTLPWGRVRLSLLIAGVAQLVEHHLAKVDVESSSLFARSSLRLRGSGAKTATSVAAFSGGGGPSATRGYELGKPGDGPSKTSGFRLRCAPLDKPPGEPAGCLLVRG
jgi:hypothetical protein